MLKGRVLGSAALGYRALKNRDSIGGCCKRSAPSSRVLVYIPRGFLTCALEGMGLSGFAASCSFGICTRV